MRIWTRTTVAFSAIVFLCFCETPDALARNLPEGPSLVPYKASGIYERGETVGWTVHPPTKGISTTEYSYTIKKNNFNVIASGKIDLQSGSAKIAVQLDEPAMLYVEVAPVEGATPRRTAVAGAAIAPTELRPVASRPEDFDAFWQAKIDALRQVPENTVLTPGDSGRAGVEYGTIRMDHLDGGHVYGQYAKPDREGKFPALLILQWASPPYPLEKSWIVGHAANGWLTLNIQPHDVLPTEPRSYYDALPERIKRYESIGQDDRDQCHFLKMYLADCRAVDHLTNHPNWDGKTLVVMGTSMGGQQGLCVAGLHQSITHLIVNVPAGCDLNAGLHCRQSGYPSFPSNNPKAMETARYFDAVNFASRIKAKTFVAMGFVDKVCPPAGIWTAYNQIPGPKEAAPMIESPHNHLATPEEQAPFTRRSAEWLDTLVKGGEVVTTQAGAAAHPSTDTAPVSRSESRRATEESEEEEAFDDHQNMMDQLGVKSLRHGADPRDQSIFNEATANPYKDSMPDALALKDGTPVTTRGQWRRRREELLEDFSREIYGRVPANAPEVNWEVTETIHGESDGIATVTKMLVGHVDNSAYPDLEVNIEASFTVPTGSTDDVPIMLSFEGGFGRRGGRRFGRVPAGTPWTDQAIAKGWGHGWISPHSIQPDNNQLRTGVIGLANKGQPRKPDDWGALRAWAWGVSQFIDFFEQNSDAGVDATKVGIEGVSRYGKAVLVTMAFDERLAVGLVASSGQGGAKLHRHIFGEKVENLTGGLYYWMAGNYIKYGASDPEMTAADLPIDSHELIALCAPRPCFISYGTFEGGDPPWVDAHGSFMAAVLAGPVYELLGAQGLGTPGDYLTDPMPPVGELIGGQLAWRQHEGGHTVTPNWPAFFKWVGKYIDAPALPESQGDAPRRGADMPSPRTDENSRIAHQELLEKAEYGATKGRVDVYFVGDSITRRWGCTDPQYPDLRDSWNENFFGWNAANFAWGGDTTSNILWRLENGELEGLSPKVFVILAGTNNLGPAPGESDAADIARGIKAIIDSLQQKAPDAKIILTAIFPRNDNRATLPVIRKINERIARHADDDQIRFLNVNDKLADSEGTLHEGMMMDGLHPARPGYEVWAAGLKPILTEWLGPPAEVDHAPPPTGDPSARPAAAVSE